MEVGEDADTAATMRIGIKATQLVDGGGRRHLEKLLQYFPREQGTQLVVFLSNTQRDFDLPKRNDIEYRFYSFPAKSLLHRLLWEQTVLRRELRRLDIDVLFEPGNLGMMGSPVPRILLIHNLAPFSPEFIAGESLFSRLRLHLLRFATRLSTKSASGVIHLTDFARSFVADSLDLNNIPQRVIYMGTDGHVSKPMSRKSIERQFNIEGQFIFCCSHIYRYKNILEVVQAFDLLRRSFGGQITLVLAGEFYDRRYTREIKDHIAAHGMESQVRMVGSVDYSILAGLYKFCDLFIFPSWLESASLILIEALQAGAPIAASNTRLCVEVLDEAALFFDPHDPSSICDAARRVLDDEILRSGLRRTAKHRAEFFSWRRTAELTAEFIKEVSGHPAAEYMQRQSSSHQTTPIAEDNKHSIEH
jgi:glycosyltransferase involved in cell wall biosynthesis